MRWRSLALHDASPSLTICFLFFSAVASCSVSHARPFSPFHPLFLVLNILFPAGTHKQCTPVMQSLAATRQKRVQADHRSTVRVLAHIGESKTRLPHSLALYSCVRGFASSLLCQQILNHSCACKQWPSGYSDMKTHGRRSGPAPVKRTFMQTSTSGPMPQPEPPQVRTMTFVCDLFSP